MLGIVCLVLQLSYILFQPPLAARGRQKMNYEIKVALESGYFEENCLSRFILMSLEQEIVGHRCSKFTYAARVTDSTS